MVFKYGILKTSWYNDAIEIDKDYELHHKVFSGVDSAAVALQAEKLLEHIVGVYMSHNPNATTEPVGIHHFGCDEIYVENGRMSFLYKVVLINDRI